MWIYKIILGLLIVSYSDCKRNALQDYQKTQGIRLVALPGSALHTKSRKLNLAKCAKTCSRNRKLSFNCRAFVYNDENTRCQWLSFDINSPGAQTQQDANFQLYQKKDYVRECIIGAGHRYKGRRSETVSGVRCQAWASSIHHEHQYGGDRSPKKDLRENYCRNPDRSSSGPWCFTTDPRIRSQPCGVPQCSQVECMRCNGEDYRGPMDRTESGKECQRWDLQEPHKHPFNPERYPDKGLDDNLCRNPDGRHRPWCFTLDPLTPWEYCPVQVCGGDPAGANGRNVTAGCYRGRGTDYRGTVGVTPGGLTCQRWDSQYPHRHTYTPQDYGCKDLRENFCRNPDGSEVPWCFTTNPRVRTANCSTIPHCDTQSSQPQDCYEGIGASYRGEQSRTRLGLPCAPWGEHVNRRYPYPHSISGDMDQEGSSCRNPDQDIHGPWCYTNHSAVAWDYCDVKPCEASQKTIAQLGDLPRVSCFVHIKIRIVGGAPVGITESSFVVSIQKGSHHWCGGSLIREKWVLTDRMCFSSCSPDLSEYRVWLGVSDLNAAANKQELRIGRLICGPDGSGLALIQLAQPPLPANNVREIQLPVAGCAISEGLMCSTYGWGATQGTGHDDVLKVVHLPVVGNDNCNKLHRGSLHITDTKICAGGRKGEGVCERDYGGPLVCQEGDSRVIVGVSVHGIGCGRAGRPGVFVNVPFYTRWIHKVLVHYENV
ncbi:hepatocyte growth factor [Aplochiton taeniatus]